jgi:hypothetical protein
MALLPARRQPASLVTKTPSGEISSTNHQAHGVSVRCLLRWVDVSLGWCANSDLEAGQMLVTVSTEDQPLALGQS